MSCSINRYKFVGSAGKSTGSNTSASSSEAAKAMEARMQEMMAVRAAQDSGNFKARPSWDTAPKNSELVGKQKQA